MMMTLTGNASNLQCQEDGRRKGAKELVVIWAYSVALVWLESSADLCLIIKCFDDQAQEPNNQINQYPKKSLISFLAEACP